MSNFHFSCSTVTACTVAVFDAVFLFGSSFFLQAIQSHSVRRSLFEQYVKTRAEEERREKRAAHKAAVEGFKQLLDEASKAHFFLLNRVPLYFWATLRDIFLFFFGFGCFLTRTSLVGIYYHPDIFQDIDKHTDYHIFKKKWGNDLRFESLERKEREALLNERYESISCNQISMYA